MRPEGRLPGRGRLEAVGALDQLADVGVEVVSVIDERAGWRRCRSGSAPRWSPRGVRSRTRSKSASPGRRWAGVMKRAYSITTSFRPPRVDGPTIALLTSVTSGVLPFPSTEQAAIEPAAIAAQSATDPRPLSFNRTLFLPGVPRTDADRTRTPGAIQSRRGKRRLRLRRYPGPRRGWRPMPPRQAQGIGPIARRGASWRRAWPRAPWPGPSARSRSRRLRRPLRCAERSIGRPSRITSQTFPRPGAGGRHLGTRPAPRWKADRRRGDPGRTRRCPRWRGPPRPVAASADRSSRRDPGSRRRHRAASSSKPGPIEDDPRQTRRASRASPPRRSRSRGAPNSDGNVTGSASTDRRSPGSGSRSCRGRGESPARRTGRTGPPNAWAAPWLCTTRPDRRSPRSGPRRWRGRACAPRESRQGLRPRVPGHRAVNDARGHAQRVQRVRQMSRVIDRHAEGDRAPVARSSSIDRATRALRSSMSTASASSSSPKSRPAGDSWRRSAFVEIRNPRSGER